MAQRGRHLAPTIRRISRTWVVPLTLVMTLVLGGVAFADTVVDSGDVAIVGDASASPGLALERGGASGTFSLTVTADDGNIATSQCDGTKNRVTVPTSFTITSTGLVAGSSTTSAAFPCHNYSGSGGSPETLTFSGLTVNATTTAPLGSTSYAITFGHSSAMVILGEQIKLHAAFMAPPIYASISDPAPTNTAPSTPGTPALASGSATPNQGLFSLTWAASSDEQDDPITYQLQHKDSSVGATFTTVVGASALMSNDFTFSTANPEAEGTWTYRVIASDGSLSSTPSAASSAIKVDQSDPNAPSLSADRAPEDSTGGWFRDTVTVTFTDNGDPNLGDGSEGSGVDPSTIPPPVTKNTSGSHTITGTVFDNVGLESVQGSLTVKVDATAPTVSFSDCPSQPLLLNSTATANWTASDAHSDLASAASGSATLNTSTVGARFVTAMATDNVGKSFTATCNYSVIYDFDGFFAPVENLSAWNSAKAGQSIPVKFSLDGDQGLNIFDPAAPYLGAPRIVQIACPNNITPDLIEEYATVTANSKLIYDSLVDQYNYVWKTDKAWAGKCFRLDVKLIDGTIHSASFKFTK